MFFQLFKLNPCRPSPLLTSARRTMKCWVLRDKNRRALYQKHEMERKIFKSLMNNTELSTMLRMRAMASLQKLPRDSCPSRIRLRCTRTGAARGNVKHYGVNRRVLKNDINRGAVAGLRLRS